MTTILFDLDGTLVETAPDLLAATNAVLDGEGLSHVRRADLNHLVGHGGRAMLGKALAMHGREADDATLDRLVPVFLDAYRASIPGDSAPFPGVREALDRMVRAGHTLAVCTNKFEGLSRALLAALDLSSQFAIIAGPDTFGVRKPDPAHILRTIEGVGGRSDDAVMIGDSYNDVEAARRAGIPSIGVPFGYTDTPIRELGPDAVIEGYDQLDADLVARVVARRGSS